MNILVRTYSGKTVFRPDTTFEHANADFYVPDGVDALELSPVLYVRLTRPGQFVERKFAQRYFDCYGYGVLLYPSDMLDGSEEGFACASCLNHSSVLPMPARPTGAMTENEMETVCSAIRDVTRNCYIRTGDLLAVEIAPRRVLCARESGGCEVREGDTGFRVIF